MNTRIRSRRIEIPRQALAHIERRLHFSLDRFELRISSIDVLIEDLNGPRGGPDKSCRIKIKLHPTGTVIVRYAHSSLNTAVAFATRCIEEAVARAVQRVCDRRPASKEPNAVTTNSRVKLLFGSANQTSRSSFARRTV